MGNEDKFLYATAEIDGEIKEYFRDGKKEGFFMHKQYNATELKMLQSSIQANMHLIRIKFQKVSYFYSDDFNFCRNNVPEVICELLKKEFKIDIDACGQGNDFIVYTDVIDYDHARNRFNNHFKGNL